MLITQTPRLHTNHTHTADAEIDETRQHPPQAGEAGQHPHEQRQPKRLMGAQGRLYDTSLGQHLESLDDARRQQPLVLHLGEWT